MNGLSLALLSLNIMLTAASVWSFLALRRVLGGTSLKSLASLTVQVADLTSAFDGLREGHQRLNSRVGMREVRARRKSEQEPEEPLNGEPQVALSSREAKLAGIRAEARKRGLM
jgi:hypothetical protein